MKQQEKQQQAQQQKLEYGERTEKVLNKLNSSGVERLEVKEFEEQPTREEIVNRLAGGDLTRGSCASLSFAYAGNCAGMDVLDFRGGNSLSTFSKTSFINEIANLEGVQSNIVKSVNDIKGVNELLQGVSEVGKEYMLATGQHAAIIRKAEDGFEYLEMQSAKNSGWHKLDNDVLRWRFGCKRSHSFYGEKYEAPNTLIDVESLGKNEGFKEILSYINTSEGSQKKGVKGFEK